MSATAALEYAYSPTDLFEASTSVALDDGEAVLADGAAVVTLTTFEKPISEQTVGRVTRQLRLAFEARTLLVRRAFELRGPHIVYHRPDGGRDIVVRPETARLTLRGSRVDLTVTDAAGAIVRDTRAERIQHDSQFIQAAATTAPDSPTLQRMLGSFAASVADPDNELVHLYEIRDSAAKHFGSETAARAALRISKADWQSLGRLANDEPLRQGRHRGKQLGELRDATADELTAARDIANAIIRTFIATL